MKSLWKLKPRPAICCRRLLSSLLAILAVLPSALGPSVIAQAASSTTKSKFAIRGVVRDAANKPVAGASVSLGQDAVQTTLEAMTQSDGAFEFPSLQAGTYTVSAAKAGLGRAITRALLPGGEQSVDLVLDGKGDIPKSASAPSPAAEAMQFADQPNFTVAGVTDWTAVGGHGSDSSLRTSEALAGEAATLKTGGPALNPSSTPGAKGGANQSEASLRARVASAPGSFAANHQLGEFYCHASRFRDAIPLLQASYQIDPANRDNEYALALALKGAGDLTRSREHVQRLLASENNADLHRLLGEIDEGLGDPLTAVHEEEQAVRLDPNEANYFAWGSELLLHRAVQQAAEVFRKGAAAYPKSARMASALGVALFAGGLYDESALRLCAAADLNPSDLAPYFFLGRIGMAAPQPLPCVEPKLQQFVQQQPRNALGAYYYAMAILKRQGMPPDDGDLHKVESLLTQAVTVDPTCGEAYLQLGILHSAQLDVERATGYYRKAIEVNSQLGEAHYRLGVAYKKAGELEKARQEFRLHDDIEKQQADAIERQRREVRQFLVVLQGQPALTPAH